jgi:hypothetical protein
VAAKYVRRQMAGRYARVGGPAPSLWLPHLGRLRGVLVEVVPGSESGAGRGASSGSLLRVCCVRRSVNKLGELQEALMAASCA